MTQKVMMMAVLMTELFYFGANQVKAEIQPLMLQEQPLVHGKVLSLDCGRRIKPNYVLLARMSVMPP